MNRKHLMEMLVATTFIAGLLISALLVPLAGSSLTPYNGDNMTVHGVLSTDSYVLYPYAANDLTWGFSKYGELINGAGLVGLSYNGMDVFSNPNVLQKDWSQGWFIDIHYADQNNNYKRAWAFALFADETQGSEGIGGGWQENCPSPLGPPYGGRETNVYATTDPITVLYDGPRSFVAQCRTTLYALSDHSPVNSGLINITLTFVFNKDSKEIVEYKDIKRLDQGKFGRDFQVEFSNRGEWDIGTTSSPPSYATFYANQSTVYDYNYHPFYSAANPITGYDVCQILDQSGTYAGFVAYWPQPFGVLVQSTGVITRTQVLGSLCTVEENGTYYDIGEGTDKAISFSANNWPTSDSYPVGAGDWSNEPMVFKNGKLLYSPGDYSWSNGQITLVVQPASSDVFVIDFKHHQPDYTGEYGIADEMDHWGAVPATPYVIGEWDFKLTRDPLAQQFRGVCVYGLTDRHNGDDDSTNQAAQASWSYGIDQIDSEVQYLLNQVFNPMDLYSAVEKKTAEWVDYYTVTTTDYANAKAGYDLTIPLNNQPVLFVENWGQYNDHSERVIWSGTLQYPERQETTIGNTGTYELLVNSKTGLSNPGYGVIDVFHGSVPAAGTEIKIIYATDTQYENTHNIILGTTNNNVTRSSQSNLALTNPSWGYDDTTFDLDYLTAGHDFYIANLNMSITNATALTVGASCNLTGSFHWTASGIHVFKETPVYITPFDIPSMTNTVTQNNIAIAFSKFKMYYNIYPPEWESLEQDLDLMVSHVDLLVSYNITAVYANATADTYNVTVNFVVGHQTADLYTESMPGRYEYGVVGRGAASVDSAGLSLISAAFKDKQVEYGWAGEDMMDATVANEMPFVMSPVTAGSAWANYYYNQGTDFRTGLKDDYCHAGMAHSYTIPMQISDANLIGVGGPLANMLAYYGNDFVQAFFGLSQFTTYGTWSNAIVPLSCWNATHEGYTDTATTGYAVVSTGVDQNGTVMFLAWGNWGRDTYYVSRWFQEDGIYEFQDLAFKGVTSVVVKITYESTAEGYKPTGFSVPEVLGTISERGIYYESLLIKGGIHEDP